MQRLKRALLVADAVVRVGPANAAVVAGYRVAAGRGWLEARPVEVGGALFARANGAGASVDATPALLEEAEGLLAGRLRGFGGQVFETGAPPDWRLNLLSGRRDISDEPWWKVGDADPEAGDIKGVWEASRFDWAVVFARAAAATGEARWIKALNAWSASWLKAFPPYRGPGWSCGQEASLRLLQVLLAARLLGQDRSPGPGMAAFVEAHLRRIAPTRLYAMAQDNNHGTSEAAALLAGGAWLERQGDGEAAQFGARCARLGRHWLEDRTRRLFFAGGGFAQYSTNYHRLALDTLVQAELWRRHLGAERFSKAFYERAAAAVDWLAGVANATTGDAPNLGANDGARAFRLDDGGFRDHRGSIQLAAAVFGAASVFDPGPWDAPVQAFGLVRKSRTPELARKRSRLWPDFGLALLAPAGGRSYAFVRIPKNRFRPNQADPLHLDLWTVDGRNLLRDAGTWSYHDRSADERFAGIGAHNTVQFDGRDPMPRLSRFLYSRWIHGRGETPRETPEGLRWKGGYHDAWGAAHRREISVADDVWTVVDHLSGRFHAAVLRWRLPQGDWKLEGHRVEGEGLVLDVEAEAPLDVVLRPGEESLRYGELTPAVIVEARVRAPVARLRTVITVV